MSPVLAITWNVGPRAAFRSLRDDLRTVLSPACPMAALFEVKPRHARLLRVAFPRWRVIHPYVPILGRRADVVLMVRRGLPVNVRVLAHTMPWTGPKEGVKHRGRGHLAVTLFPDGKAQRLVFVHRVPGGPSGGVKVDNRPAWLTESDLIRQAIHGWPRVAVLGDQNATRHEMRGEYIPMDLRVAPTLTKVDHGAVRGLPGFRGIRGGTLGSDHPVVTWVTDTTRRGIINARPPALPATTIRP